MSTISDQIFGLSTTALIAAATEAQAIIRDGKRAQQDLLAYEKGEGPAPDNIARAVANVLLKEQVGFPTDGTFTVTFQDGTVDPVEYPLTFAGFTNAVNFALEHRAQLGFKPGPDGAYATSIARAKEEAAQFEQDIRTAQAAAALGEALSKALN